MEESESESESESDSESNFSAEVYEAHLMGYDFEDDSSDDVIRRVRQRRQ